MTKRFTFGAVSPNVAQICFDGEPVTTKQIVDLLNLAIEYLSSHTSCEEKDKQIAKLNEENERLKNKLNVTALELVDEAISMGKAVEISEMNYHEFLEYRQKKGKPMELQK